MKPASVSTRWVVMTIALLLSAVALAGCHDLTNDADPGTDPGDDGTDDTGDETEDDTGDGSEDDTETGSEEESESETEDDSDEDTETGSEEESESETEEEDPPEVEEGDFDSDVEVDIENDELTGNCDATAVYNPDPIEIQVGEVVQWTNTDGCTHSATHDVPSNERLFDTDNLDGGETSASFKFNEPGEYEYFCKPHGSEQMSGKIIVTE